MYRKSNELIQFDTLDVVHPSDDEQKYDELNDSSDASKCECKVPSLEEEYNSKREALNI